MTQRLLWRVLSVQTDRELFRGGFYSRESAEVFALRALIRREIPAYYLVRY